MAPHAILQLHRDINWLTTPFTQRLQFTFYEAVLNLSSINHTRHSCNSVRFKIVSQMHFVQNNYAHVNLN